MSAGKLYWYPGTCARVPLVALEEIGQPFELETVDRFNIDPGYLGINPKGRVPALVVEGRLITENPAIETFLAHAYPEAQLLPPAGTAAQIDALAMMSWFAAGVHPSITRFRFPTAVCDVPDALPRIREMALANLLEAFGILETRLATRDWLLDTWSIVDAYMLWLWFRATGSGMDGNQFPRCYEHALRTESRPSVARALDREESELARIRAAGLLPDGLPAHQAGRCPVLATS